MACSKNVGYEVQSRSNPVCELLRVCSFRKFTVMDNEALQQEVNILNNLKSTDHTFQTFRYWDIHKNIISKYYLLTLRNGI